MFITPNRKDCEGYSYDLHTTFNKYKETHRAIFLSVPLMLQFQTNMKSMNLKKANKVDYYVMAGIKAQFLFNYNYTSGITSSNDTAYYPKFDNWITSLSILGLDPFDGNSGKVKFSILAMFAFETGAKWSIGKTVFLYTGIYFDCGLHNPTKHIRYSNYSTLENLTDFTLLKFANRTNLMAVGVKLRLAFWKIRTKQPRCF
jgi:hypothetical protein